jgi:hypothetical protein
LIRRRYCYNAAALFSYFLRTESVKMRPAFAVALAFSLALAAVRANETPQPISNFMAEPAVAEPLRSAADNEAADGLAEREASVVTSRSAAEEAATEEINAAPNDSKVCVMLKADSFEIKTGNKSPRAVSMEPAAFLFCDNVTTATVAGGATTLKCTNCKLTLPNGVSATPNDVSFNSTTNVLVLTGSDESPVTVTMAGTESKAAKIELKFDPRDWPAPAAMAPMATYGTSVPAGQPRLAPSSRY